MRQKYSEYVSIPVLFPCSQQNAAQKAAYVTILNRLLKTEMISKNTSPHNKTVSDSGMQGSNRRNKNPFVQAATPRLPSTQLKKQRSNLYSVCITLFDLQKKYSTLTDCCQPSEKSVRIFNYILCVVSIVI